MSDIVERLRLLLLSYESGENVPPSIWADAIVDAKDEIQRRDNYDHPNPDRSLLHNRDGSFPMSDIVKRAWRAARDGMATPDELTEFANAISDEIERLRALLEEVVREREQLSTYHQAAVIEIERLRVGKSP